MQTVFSSSVPDLIFSMQTASWFTTFSCLAGGS
jgi:hypothetical protein